jgi:single-strand DNA-binding protein
MEIITIAGRIGKDAEMRRLQSGDAITSFSVAVDRRQGGEKVTKWYDCSIFGDRGTKVAEYIRKGDNITVTGRPDARLHDGKIYHQIAVNDFTLQGGKRDDAPARSAPQTAKPEQAKAAPACDLDDEIPF